MGGEQEVLAGRTTSVVGGVGFRRDYFLEVTHGAQ